jgi:uncharacterized damage-inducible protein DinB
MISPEHVRLMARYNRWQNRSLYTAAATLDEAGRRADRGAFFGSIDATLGHLLWGDRIWMSRLAGTEPPKETSIAQSTKEGGDWDGLCLARAALDAAILTWADTLTEAEIAADLHWFTGALQRDMITPRWICITHMFNHQTHHRGQVHAMLTAAGARPEDTDIPFMPEDV